MTLKRSRILILGESNSVFENGWVQGFAASLDALVKIDNRSIGSTGLFNTLQYFASAGEKLTDYDAVIIDSGIQDTLFYRHDPLFYFRLIEKISDYLEKLGIFLSIVHFQSLDMLPRQREFTEYFVDLCKRREIQLFSVAACIDRVLAEYPAFDRANVYVDNFHLHHDISSRIGNLIGAEFETRFHAKKSDAFISGTADRFMAIIDNQFFKDQSVTIAYRNISTKIVDFDLFNITSTPVTLPLPAEFDGAEIVGVLFNAPTSNGFLELTGLTTSVKNFSNDTRFYWGEKLIWGRPFHHRVKLGRELTLRVHPHASTFEQTEYCQDAHFDTSRNAAIEIVGLCVIFPDQPMRAEKPRVIPQYRSQPEDGCQEPSLDEKKTLAMLFSSGRFAEAASVAHAMTLRFPANAFGWKVAGAVLKQTGKNQQALVLMQKAVELAPRDHEAHNNLGATYYDLGRIDEAVASYQRAIDINADYVECLINMANAFQRAGRFNEAVEGFLRALKIRPNLPEAFANLAVTLHHLDRYPEAIDYFKKALKLSPDCAEAHCNLGNTLREMGRLDDAEKSYRQALAIRPDFAEAHSNLGNALNDLRRFKASEASCRRALAIKPDYAEAFSNLGNALHGLGRLKEAETVFRRSLELKPDFIDAKMNLSYLLLSAGKYEEGWRYNESRYDPKRKDRISTQPPVAFPQWLGESLMGKTLLVWPEQGLGDQLQFYRYVSILKERGAAKITFVCSPPLTHLIGRVTEPDVVIASAGDPIQSHDYWTFHLSIPFHCKTTVIDVPATIPYLYASKTLQSKLATQFSDISGLKVGLCWKGSTAYKGDTQRSIGLAPFKILFSIAGVRFFNLQKGSRIEFCATAGDAAVDIGHEIDELTQPFEETAALIMNMDLVITCDTSIGHLAGALGKAVWLLLPIVPDWRWLMEREDSPWYPNTRIFRQQNTDDWEEVFERAALRLQSVVARETPVLWPLHCRESSVMSKSVASVIHIPISIGELLDKIVILEINATSMTNATKRANVVKELAALNAIAELSIQIEPETQNIIDELREVNRVILDVENRLRDYEKSKTFGAAFIECARSVCIQNDQRANLKKRLNELTGS